MSAVTEFNERKRQLGYARALVSLIGSPYHGGGGGGIGSISSAAASICVYHQERDGSTNYHDSDKEFNAYLAKSLIKNQDKIIADALAAFEADCQALAAKALKEHEQLMASAGLVAMPSAT